MSVTSAMPREKAIARILELTGRPDATSQNPWLVVTVGLPASGKSTFARQLAAATGAIRLESDDLRSALFETPTHDPDESRQLFDALYGAARVLLDGGVNVIVDATNLRERDRRPAYELATATGTRLLILHFRATQADTVRRLTDREEHTNPDDRSTAGMAVYTRMAETEEPLFREHWKIDTSDTAATGAALRRAIETLKSTTQDVAQTPHGGGSNS